MKSVRMADIAERLGISVVSVSKGLSGKDGVSDEMRARIMQTAEEMGYEASPRAGAAEAQKRRTENVGILVAERFFDESTFYAGLYRELLKSFAAENVSLLLEIVTQSSEARRTLPVFVGEEKVKALIFLGEFERDYMEAVTKGGLPYLLLDFYNEGFPGDCVLSDNVRGGYCMAEHLIRKGRRRLAFVGSVTATSSNMDRYLGFVKALIRAGIEPRRDWQIEDRSPEGGFTPLILPAEMPEAFVCCNDETAFHLVELLKKQGYRVPEDIAVTGYDDFRFSTMCKPPLTTYQVNVREMARLSAEIIGNKLNGRLNASSTMTVQGRIIVREST